MLSIRDSCRSSAPICLRTSRVAAAGVREKSLGAMSTVSCATTARSPTRSRSART